jgi:flagellar secretion chaperone FliS
MALLANSYVDQYKQREVETASQEELLLLLYDGAIRFLNIAKKAMRENEIEKSHRYLLKTQSIINEFMVTLNFEVGGEPAQNLYQLYEYLYYRLVQANIHKDSAMVDEVLQHLRLLKDTWEKAIDIARKEDIGASASSKSKQDADDSNSDRNMSA